MHLKDALGFGRGQMVALIGAGGKTTTLYRLAKELREEGGKVLVTTTTKIFKPARPHVDRLFLVQHIDALRAEISRLDAPAIIGAGSTVDDDGKLIGLPCAWLDALVQSPLLDAILVEADGAASKLLKVPSETEPVVPRSSHLAVWIMAIKVLGEPLDSRSVHRAERAAALLGVPCGIPLTEEHIVQLIKHPLGCLKSIAAHCRKAALINQADSSAELQRAKKFGQRLAPLGFERVVITSYLGGEPVKEVMTT